MRFHCPYRANLFLTGAPGRRSRTSLPWADIRSPFRGKRRKGYPRCLTLTCRPHRYFFWWTFRGKRRGGHRKERAGIAVHIRLNSTPASTVGLRPNSEKTSVVVAYGGIVCIVTNSSKTYSMQMWQSSFPRRGYGYQPRASESSSAALGPGRGN